MKKAAIVILNWNGWKNTLQCLKTIDQLSVVSYQLSVIVVDNGSTDNSVKFIKELINRKVNELMGLRVNGLKNSLINNSLTRNRLTINLIENKKNLGYAEGNNVGIKYALKQGADYVMLLNNDTLVDKYLVDQLVKVMEEDKEIGILGPKIYFAHGFEFHKDRYKKEEEGKVIWYAGGEIDWENVYCSHKGVDEVDKGQYEKQEETDFISGCCMMVRRKVFDKIGFLDKKYFLYLEDVDFCIRAERAKFKIIYTPKAHLWHKNAASSEKPGSKIHQYYQTRNRLYFGFRYAPLRSKLALFRESMKFILKNNIKRKACLDFYLGRFGGKKIG